MTSFQTTPPQHVAIIMDGNGRWARQRGFDRTLGHIRGARVAKKIIEWCAQSSITHLTLYAFSTENWLRPKSEVNLLMRLLAKNMRRERKTLMKNNIRFNVIGDLTRLPEAVLHEVTESLRLTAHNTGMTLTFALSYGGRQEITQVAKLIAQKVLNGELAVDAITEDLFGSYLNSFPLPDPDLILRTSGESRLSNFLSWQSAYSEIVISQVLWPDFTVEYFKSCLNEFAQRSRRFGRVEEDRRPFVQLKHNPQAQ